MSNFGLYKALDKLDIKYAKTKVGDKYVYEYMKENNCVIGGEQSGHIIFIKDASTGDGILTSLKVLEVLANTNKKVSLLVKDIDIYPQVLINIKVSDKEKVKNDLDVINSIKLIESKLDNTGRILVRESGTEPLIRVMVEAKDINICNEYANIVINTIKNKGYEVK
jgi:phosphoglucosamine mutase